jgi:glycosyltransferase involved in cell wall biosynthesis
MKHERAVQADGADGVPPRPLVSLVIPVRDEEESISSLLDCIKLQTCPPAEIIIVDGGSVDRTVDIARDLISGDTRFLLFEAGTGSPGRNRNIGAEAARHPWIAFTDAGTKPESSWLEALIEVARLSEAEVIYGNYEPIEGSFFERCAALSYSPAKAQRPGGYVRGPSTASMMIRREVWEKIGGFPDLRAAEDLIFFDSVKAGGFKVAWAPRATVWWHLQPTLLRTFQRFALYSKHNVWAKRQCDWHHGTARQYLLIVLFAALAGLHTPWWLLAIPAWLLARVFRGIWRRREGRGFWWAVSPARFACVGLIVVTIDLATFVGWINAVRKPPERRSAT